MPKINNYEWIEFSLPSGWHEIAHQMIKECESIDSTYTIIDLKEKFGSMRVYSYCKSWYDDKEMEDYGFTISNIEDKYEQLSSKTCCKCGKPATKVSTGWVLPWCDKCGTDEEKYYKRFKDEQN